MNLPDGVINCGYNIDSGYLEIVFDIGIVFALKCDDYESMFETNIRGRAAMQLLLDENPMEYAELALEGGLEKFCMDQTL